jgi:hypothetical protein
LEFGEVIISLAEMVGKGWQGLAYNGPTEAIEEETPPGVRRA